MHRTTSTRLATAAAAAAVAVALTAGLVPAAASARDKAPALALAKCEQSHGTIAVVDGDTQGWTKYGLGSPRELIAAMALESGCFTPHSAASGVPATYLMNVIAGDKEQVDQSVNLAKTVAIEGMVRSGAAAGMLRSVPLAGGMLGMFGGLGGKKKTVAAGIRLISPANGQTIVSGTGDVTKSTISFGSPHVAWATGTATAGYATSKDGKMLAEAFIKAFNAVSSQGPALAAVQQEAPAAAQPSIAVETRMLASPATDAAPLRSLRAGTAVKPTGKREGLFIEVEDGFGTKGWVSVEDMR